MYVVVMTIRRKLLLFWYLWIELNLCVAEGFWIPSSRQGFRGVARKISSGLTFEDGDGDQILVSVQKPLGIILEQDESDSVIRIADMDPTGSGAAAGLRIGDILLAVQNADMMDRDLEYALNFITKAPKVLNLRFTRMPVDE